MTLNPMLFITAKRFQYLYRLYMQAKSEPMKTTYRQYRIGKEIGFDTELTDFIVTDLRDKGLVMFADQGQVGGEPENNFDLKLAITPKGMEEVESAIEKPHSPTKNFPVQAIRFASGRAVPDVQWQKIYTGNAGQETKGGAISDPALIGNIRYLVIKRIRDSINKFNLSQEEKDGLLSKVMSMEDHLLSSPRKDTVVDLLVSIKSTLENELQISAPAFIIIHNIIGMLHIL